MNTFNRIIMVLTILTIFFVVTVGLVVPQQTLQVISSAASSTLHTLSRIRPEFIITVP